MDWRLYRTALVALAVSGVTAKGSPVDSLYSNASDSTVCSIATNSNIKILARGASFNGANSDLAASIGISVPIWQPFPTLAGSLQWGSVAANTPVGDSLSDSNNWSVVERR